MTIMGPPVTIVGPPASGGPKGSQKCPIRPSLADRRPPKAGRYKRSRPDSGSPFTRDNSPPSPCDNSRPQGRNQAQALPPLQEGLWGEEGEELVRENSEPQLLQFCAVFPRTNSGTLPLPGQQDLCLIGPFWPPFGPPGAGGEGRGPELSQGRVAEL